MNKPVHLNTEDYITSLIVRARQAQNVASGYSQEKVDELVTAIVWNIVKDGPAQEISQMAVDESRMGNYESKYAKLMTKCKGTLRDMKGKKSAGIIEVDEGKGLFKVAKPVGIVAGILPCTNPEATPVIKAIMAIKTRNAIILAPHPRTKKTNTHIVNIMRTTLKQYNAPEDLIIGIEEPTLESTNELMKQCDLVVATGGGALVKSAYSSGTPAYGVGQGNSVVVVDETADLKDAANKVMRSKTFDFATSCSTENSLVIQKKIYAEFVACLKGEGGYLLSPEQKTKLQQAMWVDHHLNAKIIAQPVQTIASVAGINIPKNCKFIMVEENQIGPNSPFSGEKLSVVVALFQYDRFQEAIDHVNEITNYHGRGHSCGIHSFNEEHIKQLALATKTSRIMVRQPQCLANSGAWTNGMPMTLTLGCGTWGGNASSSNITWKDLLNITWVSSPIEHTMPTDEELFGEIMLNNKN
ncbi:aldehyde dehydrogenase family protein [Pelosinus propionicus]|uniref:Sulfoacetaldehyde dehydrogenase n=1 Tax=Pelosinus propionicus DSM 13327 TaxID=1123291 RepID=A0A1I4QBC3_9FIRM|nr:aldehyde dehydrogenase family protein [Pelosinus propionicus]SFM37392.1 sulfoacetaldehyde dehydrogenase [Pelosinus propionicus DSM 13327]